jgi:hypothetical protein
MKTRERRWLGKKIGERTAEDIFLFFLPKITDILELDLESQIFQTVGLLAMHHEPTGPVIRFDLIETKSDSSKSYLFWRNKFQTSGFWY